MVQMNIDAEIDADGPFTLTLTTSGSGTGSVVATPGVPYYYGDSVSIEAFPDAGCHFVVWSGDHSGSVNPGTIVIDGDMTC